MKNSALRLSRDDYVRKGMKALKMDIPNYLRLCREKVLSDTNLLSG